MRILMLGTGPFAVPTFRALCESGHEVAALVTRPEHSGRGGRKPPPNPMRGEAEARGVRVFAPESVNTDEARAELAALASDLLVVCDYGQILKSETLAVARHGGVNLHASLLPKYRGAAPFQWAIYHGETETGDSVIRMTAGLDAGPVIGQCRTPIGPDETAGELEPRLAAMGAPLVLAAVEQIAAGAVAPLPQDPSQATKAPRLRKADGRIDWSRSAAQIKNQVRAFEPWPRSHTDWRRDNREPGATGVSPAPTRLIVRRVALTGETSPSPPGVVLEAAGRLLVATGEGVLEVLEIQPAGKRSLAAAEFLRGYPLEIGQRLG